MYLVTEDGRIFNENTGKELKQYNNGNGYLKLTLTIDRVQVQKLSHRIVAETYLPNKSKEVNHKDGNRSNNHISNLEWVTGSENQKHAFRTGIRGSGDQLYNAKFSTQDLNKIVNLYKNGAKKAEIAREMKCSCSTIGDILNGKRYVLMMIRDGIKLNE